MYDFVHRLPSKCYSKKLVVPPPPQIFKILFLILGSDG